MKNKLQTSLKLLAFTFGLLSFNSSNAQNALVWAKSFGGADFENPKDMIVDENGNMYIVGAFGGTCDFDPGPNVENIESEGFGDIYVLKLDASGNLLWVKTFGSSGSDIANSVALDANGNVYIAGSFASLVDFDPGTNVYNLSSIGQSIFVLKLNSSGDFVWAHAIGGSSPYLTLDTSNNLYIAGQFGGTVDFNPGSGTFNITSTGFSDIFLLKLNSDGNFMWAKSIAGENSNSSVSISNLALDEASKIYLAGFFPGTVDFNPGTDVFNMTSTGSTDIFILKLDANGDFVWAKSVGGSNADAPRDIVVDSGGAIYLCGEFQSTADFNPGSDEFNLSSNGSYDVFVLKLDNSGNLDWAKSFGGSAYDTPAQLTIDGLENVYVIGSFRETVDFDPGNGTFNLTSPGSNINDAFVLKLNAFGEFQWAFSNSGSGFEIGSAIQVDANFNVYTAGQFDSTVDFDPFNGVLNLSPVGAVDAYIQKITQSSPSVSISEGAMNSNFSLYPNPATTEFTITNAEIGARITLVDLAGKVMYTGTVSSNNHVISSKDLVSGIYFVQVENNGQTSQKKLVINK